MEFVKNLATEGGLVLRIFPRLNHRRQLDGLISDLVTPSRVEKFDRGQLPIMKRYRLQLVPKFQQSSLIVQLKVHYIRRLFPLTVSATYLQEWTVFSFGFLRLLGFRFHRTR